MSGHRKKPKRITDTERFLADAEAIHRIIIGYSGCLRVSCAHYQAMQQLHNALLQAIFDVTGKEAPWIYRSSSAPRLDALASDGGSGKDVGRICSAARRTRIPDVRE